MADDPGGGPERSEDRILSWKKVRDLTGVSRTTAWRLQRAGDFPLPVVISPGRVGWRESEILRWQASRAPRSAMHPPRGRKARSPGEAPHLAQALIAPQEMAAAPSRPVPPGPPGPPDQIKFDF